MEQTKKTNKSFSMYDFVGKDKLRPVLSGVYHDAEKQVAVATDGHIMMISKKDYKPEFAGKIIDKNGAEIVGRYPNWKFVVPQDGFDATFYFDLEAIKAKEREFIETEGKITCKNIIRCYLNVTETTGLVTKYLKKLSGAGITGLQYNTNKLSRAFVYKDENKTALLMPCTAC